jgi:hypothetical protein
MYVPLGESSDDFESIKNGTGARLTGQIAPNQDKLALPMVCQR